MSHATNRPWIPKAVITLLLVLSLAIITGCPTKPPATAPTAPAPVERIEPPPSPAPEKVVEPPPRPYVEQKVQETEIDDLIRRQNSSREFLRTIHFDFDKYDIRDDQVPILQANASWLKAHSDLKLVIQGHCDERGTIEYNLSLGDRRARSVKKYLADLGVSEDRMRTVSYGKERPIDPGHDDDAWAKNRRGEFELEK